MKIAAAVLALGLACPAAAEPAVNFDEAIDVKSIVAQAKQESAKVKSVETVSTRINRYESDCVTFSFSPTAPAQSEAVWLRSQEWIRYCEPGDPRRGGGGCWERPGQSYHERAQVTLRDRQALYPWESDNFRVCLNGPWLDVYQLESAYDYKRVGGRQGDIVVAPARKTPMRPDQAGLTAKISSSLLLSFADRWASYYAGEQTGLKLTLKREVPGWFDVTVADIELNVPAGAQYDVNWLDYAAKFSEKLQGGKTYYVKYSFRRTGSISKNDWVKGGESGKTVYRPSAGAIGR